MPSNLIRPAFVPLNHARAGSSRDHSATTEVTTSRPDSGRTLAVAAAGTALVLVAFTVPLATISGTATDLGAGPGAQAWVLSSMSVGSAAGLLSSGTIGDDYGRRRTFLAGAMLLAASSLLGALAPTALVLIIARIVQGLGGAAMLACGLGLVGQASARATDRRPSGASWLPTRNTAAGKTNPPHQSRDEFTRTAVHQHEKDDRSSLMRATLIYGAGDVRVEDVPDPVVQEPTDAVVRVLRGAICGSHLWPYGSRPATGQGEPIGHEFLGVVEDVGAEVSGFKRGDVVVAPFAFADNTCEFCVEGLHTSCPHGGVWGVGGVNGGQAEAVRVPLAQGTLVKLPVGEDSVLLPSLLTLADVFSTGHHAAFKAGIAPGTSVTVIGDGAVGLLAVLAASGSAPS